MRKYFSPGIGRLITFCVVSSFLSAITTAQGQTPPPATVLRVAVVGDESGMAVAITSSKPVIPETRQLSGPDRIVIDFPNTLPAPQLRGVSAKHHELKGIRVGLHESQPPITRVVLDMTRPGSYEVVPAGNTIVVKLGGPPAETVAVSQPIPAASTVSMGSVTITRRPISAPENKLQVLPAAQVTPAIPAEQMPPVSAPRIEPEKSQKLDVKYRDGLLTVSSNQATLSEVLYEVQQRTGAEIAIPSGAEKDKVTIRLGPGSPKEVMATLLNGSRFNFILVGSPQDVTGLRSIILTPKDSAADAAQSSNGPVSQPAAGAPQN